MQQPMAGPTAFEMARDLNRLADYNWQVADDQQSAWRRITAAPPDSAQPVLSRGEPMYRAANIANVAPLYMSGRINSAGQMAYTYDCGWSNSRRSISRLAFAAAIQHAARFGYVPDDHGAFAAKVAVWQQYMTVSSDLERLVDVAAEAEQVACDARAREQAARDTQQALVKQLRGMARHAQAAAKATTMS